MRTYTFTECYTLLSVNPKTLRKWLENEKIEPQQGRADTRIRYLTQEQVEHLAQVYERNLRPLEEQPQEHTTPGAYKLLQERLDDLENTVNDAVAEIGSAQTTIYASTPSRSELADLHTLLTSALERITTLEEQLTQAQETIATLQAPKRPTKAKSEVETANTIPEGLTSWRTFANLHMMPQTTVRNHIRQGYIPIVEGRWKVGNGYVTEVLDAKGRREFWVQYHKKEGFGSCDDCPHNIEMGTRREQGGNETGIEQEQGGNETGTEPQAAL